MSNTTVAIRHALPSDAAAIADIYNEAIRSTTATFDTEPKSAEERLRWLEAHDERHPVFVAELDGQVVGWAALTKWSDRSAYDQTAESSFYVAQPFRGRGIGRSLKERLIEEARRLGFHTILARVAEESDASIRINESFGFQHVGTMKEVGLKFGRRLDVHLMQLMLGEPAKSKAAEDGSPVLLVIDMLNDFFERGRYDRNTLVQAVNALVGDVRTMGVPIIWVRQEFEPDLSDAFLELRRREISITIKHTSGCDFLPELDVQPIDHVLVKKRYSAFFGTELDALLKRLGADCLILAGINTHACIRMTAIDAYQRDFDVVVARDCVASNDPEHHAISLRYMDGKIARVLGSQEICSVVSRKNAGP